MDAQTQGKGAKRRQSKKPVQGATLAFFPTPFSCEKGVPPEGRLPLLKREKGGCAWDLIEVSPGHFWE
jgi:hypothetical protein